jgi:hypothetical protein
MIGNRKFCRSMVTGAPGTVIEIFKQAANSRKHGLPLGQFARNIAVEAISNKDSSLYHEDEGYESGYFGYVKPFSEAVFGNYELVESLGDKFGSPLDIQFGAYKKWDAEQLEVYTRGILLTLKDYLHKLESIHIHSYALYRALGNVESICSDLYMFDPDSDKALETDAVAKFQKAIDFAVEAVKSIDREKGIELGTLRVKDPDRRRGSLCDHLAELMFNLLCSAATVKGDGFSVWHIMHNIGWRDLFGHGERGGARDAVRFKLRRLLYNEIRRLERLPNYKSARVLGLCLYAMGLNERRFEVDRDFFALKKAVLAWTRRNYMRLVEIQPEVAATCLVGSLSFEKDEHRICKSYEKGLSRDVPKECLALNAPAEPEPDWLSTSG